MKWINLAASPPTIKGEYIVRSKENGAKHVLPFSGKHFYKIGNGFQATQFEWLDESPDSNQQDQDKLMPEVIQYCTLIDFLEGGENFEQAEAKKKEFLSNYIITKKQAGWNEKTQGEFDGYMKNKKQ